MEYYGATEGHGVTVVTTPPEWLNKRGSVGRAALGTLHICDDEGVELGPPGDVGTVYFEREQAPPFEYHNDPEKTSSARHPGHDNWSTVGDVGYLDEDGYLFLTDRKAFMIISGGVNIYPPRRSRTCWRCTRRSPMSPSSVCRTPPRWANRSRPSSSCGTAGRAPKSWPRS